jgi:hypothetical protein
MQTKSRSFQNWGILLLGAVAFAAFYFIKNLKGEDVFELALGKKSDVVVAALNGAKSSPRILSRTGKIVSKDFKLDKLGPREDSLAFRVILKGEKSTATIKTQVVKQPSGEWKMIKSDTTFTN